MSAWTVQRFGSELVLEGCGDIDPHLLNILLRHRPQAALPFTLLKERDRLVFIFDLEHFVSLGQYIHALGRKASGRALLLSLIEAMQTLNEHLLWPDASLATPGLVFIRKVKQTAHFIALPVAGYHPPGMLHALLPTLEKTGDFSADKLKTISELLATDDYLKAIELLSPPRVETVKKPSLKDQIKHRLLLWQYQIKAHLQRKSVTYDDREFEITAPLSESEESQAIGILSEGLPGTVEEERGQKAFILVDEFLVGRDSQRVDFRLDDERCGRIHARIIRRRDLFFIEDLGSTNGTIVDGLKLPKHREVRLPEQAKIQFGSLVYYFTSE